MAKSRDQLRKAFLNKREWNELLLDCAYKGDKAGVIEALDHGADIDAPNLHRETALHIATINGDMALTALLLGRNANLLVKDETGRTPVEWAIKNEHKNLVDMFDRREKRLKSEQAQSATHSQSDQAGSTQQASSQTKQSPPAAKPAQANQTAQNTQSFWAKQASSMASSVPGALYNMGKYIYDSGIASVMANAALNMGQFMYDSGFGAVIGKAVINNRINAFKRKLWLGKQAVNTGSYLFSMWLGTTPANTAKSEAENYSKPIRFMNNKDAKLEQHERGVSRNAEDGSIFYHVGDKKIPVKVSSDPSEGVSQSTYDKLLAQLNKLNKFEEIKTGILQKIEDLRKSNEASATPLSQEDLEKKIIKEVNETSGIKLEADDLRNASRLDEKLMEAINGFYILERCNEMKLRILEKISDLHNINKTSSTPLSEEELEKKIIEEIYAAEGIRFTAEELHDRQKFDDKIVDETINLEAKAELTPEEQKSMHEFVETQGNFVGVDNVPERVEPKEPEVTKKPDPRQVNYDLLVAAYKGDIQALKMAIDKGANLNYQDEASGNTALHYLANTRSSPEKIAPRLLELGANPSIQNKVGNIALHEACIKGENGLVYALLENNLDTINIANKAGMTALHLAAESSDPTTLRVMLELMEDNEKAAREDINVSKVEVDIDHQDVHGNSPLHLAVINNHRDNVSLLCSNHANVNVVDKFGDTALHIAISSKNPEIKDIAVLSELIPTDQQVINHKGFDGSTLMHKAALYAAKSGDSSVYDKLIENGGNPLVVNDMGVSPQQIMMNYAINADKRKGETMQIEDGKTERQLPDFLPVCVALGSEVEIKKAVAISGRKDSELLAALGAKDRSKLNQIRQRALENFASSGQDQRNITTRDMVVRNSNTTAHGL